MKNEYNYNEKVIYRFIHFISLTFFLLLSGFAITQERINLGLYGGASLDLAYDTNYRIFSAVRSPGSLFYSDDTCKTWTQAFPTDSLEYGTQQGWSGGRQLVTNLIGWIGIRTEEEGGTYNSSVISFYDGDSGTFRTAFNNEILSTIDPAASFARVSAVGITDHWFYIGMDNYLLRMNDTSTYGAHNVLFNLDTVSQADTCTEIQYIAAANTQSGFPLLIVTVPANTEPGNGKGKLLWFDGFSFIERPHPTETSGGGSTFVYYFQKVWIHPADTTLDTVIVSTKEKSLNTIKIFYSNTNGTNWTNITPISGTNWPLQNADYFKQWESSMPVSRGMRLSFPGGAYSDNFGASWSGGVVPDNAVAFSPNNPDLMIGSKNKGPQLSYDGGSSFVNPDNEGHAAVSITKIAQHNRKTYYVATKTGLGYTIAYHNNAVIGVRKWQPPYGDFPISGIGGDGGVTAVDIDPSDSLHVIVGYDNGFYYTTTGPTGFTQITPTDWNSGTHRDDYVNDVQFINSDTIIAVSGTGSNIWPSLLFDYGNIWLSTDGGASWTKSHPSDSGVDFEQGNTVAVAQRSSNTVVYVGCGYWDTSFPTVNGQLWKSTDYGSTWHFVNTGPTSQKSGSMIDSMPIYDIDVYPEAIDTLFLASGENLNFAFAKSVDGGTNYSYININPEGAFSSVMVHSDKPDIVSVAARRDLWRYNTILNSSTLVFEGLPGEFVPDLEYGSTILGTNMGLFKLSETPGSITTVWNGTGNWSDATNWSNGIPYNICKAIIHSGNVNVDIDGEASELVMNPQTALTIDSGKNVSINGNFTLKSDTSGYASFIDKGTFTVTGNIQVERYISQDQWHYLTPPVSNATANVFNSIYLKYWNESSQSWIYITNASDPLLAGKGYSTWSSGATTGNITLVYTGNLNTGDYSPAISLSGDTASNYGWNLLGNAYPSAFDWDNASIIKTHIDNTVYYWNGTQYVTYNGTTHIGSTGISQYVPSQQGFFVHAYDANPAITITQSSRTHNTQEFLNLPNATVGLLRLHVNGNDYQDETIILFNETATNDVDPAYDAYKLFGIDQAPQLFSYDNNSILSMNVQPFDGPVETIALGFETGISGAFTIRAEGLNNFANDMIISLEDTKTNQLINLRNDSSYNFNADFYEDPHRFIIYFDRTTVGLLASSKQNKQNVLIYLDNNNILNIKNLNGKALDGEVKIYDILGRLQKNSNIKGSALQQISLHLKQGIYVVVLKTQFKTISKRVKVF